MPAPLDSPAPTLPETDATRTLLDLGWRFHEGDIPVPEPVGHHATYLSIKAGTAPGAAALIYDDSDWREVRLPHDWASEQPFVESANISQGYRPRGIGWYRRALRLDPADRGKKIELQIGAIATHATIWINGSIVAHSFSGYTSLYIDITPFARYGDDLNIIAIRADATAMEGWWYEGAGLYRNVWLARRASVSIITDGIHCDPRQDGGGRWRVPVTATLTNIETAPVTVTVEASLVSPDGQEITRGSAGVTVVPVLDQATASLSLDAGQPRLWSVDSPTLYTLRTRVLRDGKVIDERNTPIGFRSIRFDADKGFFLNDQPVKLKGVCIHQDHAGVGVAVPDSLIHWRLLRLKAMGCNAIRMSSHAPTAELLDWCDRLGFLVMNENRLFNPAPEYLGQLEWLVQRDRNHPSVILWCLFNEEPMQGTESGVEMVRRMVMALKRLDDSRPVTAAMNGSFYDPVNVSTVVDVMGFNYYQEHYDRYHARNPGKPIISSEDTSAYQTRGAFESDPSRNIITSYDKEAASWGNTHRQSWKNIAERPFIAGGFVWTGFDYHGEPTPHAWPSIASFFGILDLCGFPKTAFGIHAAHWIDDRPVIFMAPHWTWPGREGQMVKLFISSNADEVILKLNGREIGRQKADRFMGNEWDVPYTPGRIEAVALRDGKPVASAMHETAGPPVALRLTPARTSMAGDGEEVQPITIDAVDSKGRHVPTANLMTRFQVEGASIIGVGNGDPNSHEPEQGNSRSLFNGLAQIIIRADQGKGRITLRAEADGLKPARLSIERLAASPRPQVPVTPPRLALEEWRRSPLLTEKPAPALAPADGDNNSWAFLRAGITTPAESQPGWRVYRTRFQPWKRMAAEGGLLRFEQVGGRAELWVDGRLVAEKSAAGAGPLQASFPPGSAARSVVLLVESAAGAPSGLLGKVSALVNG
ncbi:MULTISPECIES: beta-galactosidase GalA [unclassified Azospirillum]|uniref:beta-galactosidase GalA n=1 Tax=unclassified Azospirillum TaxID=2630922 RepID=UPI00190ED220|nr:MULTISPECIES: beta-galactosidase GalA [unclassified Azospirillum]